MREMNASPRTCRGVHLVLALAVAFLVSGTGVLLAQAQDQTGPLDATFGDGEGKVVTSIGSGADVARGMVRQPDGKLVVAGHSHNGTDDDFAVVRYKADGSLDTTFGNGGKVVTDIWSSDGQVHAVALQGVKIIVAGHIDNGRNDEFAVVRYHADGSLDEEFGDDGFVTLPDIHGIRQFGASFPTSPTVGTRFEFTANASGLTAKEYLDVSELVDVTSADDGDVFQYDGTYWIRHDGSYEVGSVLPEYGGIFEFNAAATGIGAKDSNGNPVNTAASGDIFNYDGTDWVKHAGSYNTGTAFSTSPTPSNGDLFKFSANASGLTAKKYRDAPALRDVTSAERGDIFWYDGTYWIKEGHSDVPEAHDARVTAVSVLNNGKIVVDGYLDNPAGAEFVSIRFESGGTYDSYLLPARVNSDIAPGVGSVPAMAVRDDGEIAVAGHIDGDFAVAFYTDYSGMMITNSAFNRDGVALHDFGGDDRAHAVAWVDGDIVAVGASDNRFALVRYADDGTLVASVTTAVGSGQDRAYAVAPSGDGEIVVAGSSGDDFALVRYVSPPGAPTITSGAVGPRSLTLIWTEPDGNPTGYDVQYKPSGGDYWSDVGHTGTGLTATVCGLSEGTEYDLRVRSRNLMGVSAWSYLLNSASLRITRPGVPTGLSAVSGSNNLSLTWTAPAGVVDYYQIQYKPSDRSDWRFADRVVGGSDVGRRIWGLYGGVQYDVRIRAVNAAGIGDWSRAAQGAPSGPQTPPHIAAMGLTAQPGDGSLVLSWNETSSEITGYEVQYKRSGDDDLSWVRAEHSGVGRVKTLRGLANWVHYDVRVRGTFASGRGPWAEIQATPGASAGRLGNPSSVTVSFSETSVQEPATVTVTATLDSPAPLEGVTLWFWAEGATSDPATLISDFRWLESHRGVEYGNGLETKSIRVGPGETTATAVLEIRHNAPGNEPDEGVGVRATVDLGDADQNRLIRYLYSPTVVMTIAEWVPLPLGPPTDVNLSVDPARVREDAGTVTVKATLDNPVPGSDAALTLNLSRGSGTATAVADYTMPNPSTIVIPSGQRSGTAEIRVKRDGEQEGDETLTVNAATTTRYGGLSGTATLTIEDFHGSIVVGTLDGGQRFVPRTNLSLTVNEVSGPAGTYFVKLGARPTADVVVTADITPSGGADKLIVEGRSLTFTPDNWNQRQRVRVFGKRDDDGVSDVLTLTHAASSTDPAYSDPRVPTSVKVTVTDTWTKPRDSEPNYGPTVANAIADVTINEIGGTKQISLDGVFSDRNRDSLVITATSGDQNTATVVVADDYSSLTLTAKGWGFAPITVKAADPDGATALDHFSVTVDAPQGNGGVDGQGGSARPTSVILSLDQASVRESAGTVAITATLDAPAPDGGVGGFLFVDPGSTADADIDFSAPFEIFIVGGETSATATIGIVDDEVGEDDETVVVSAYFDLGTVQLEDEVTLTIVDDDQSNRLPTVADAIPDVTIVNERGTQLVSLTEVFSDPDDDSLTIAAASSNEAVATASVAADYSSLTLTAKSRGTANITVAADDGNGGTVSDAFTVRVKAAPVVLSSVSDISDLDGGGDTRGLSLIGVFRDADGDALMITATSSDEDTATVSVSLDFSKLSLVGVAPGTATVTVTAQDSDGNQVSDAFQVLVVEPPSGSPTVISPLPDFSLEGLEHRTFDLSIVFQDPDGDELAFTTVSSNYAVATTLWVEDTTLTVLATGTGTATITVTAKDPDGNRVSDAFEVSVTPAS